MNNTGMTRVRLAVLALVIAIIGLVIGRVHAQQPVNVAQCGGATCVAAICDDPSKVTSVNINLSASTGSTEIVALSGSTVIYVCGYSLIAGGSDATKWNTGTGSACGTGTATKATFNFNAAGDGIAIPSTGAVQMKTSAGGALCLNRTSSVTLSGVLTYVQQ